MVPAAASGWPFVALMQAQSMSGRRLAHDTALADSRSMLMHGSPLSFWPTRANIKAEVAAEIKKLKAEAAPKPSPAGAPAARREEGAGGKGETKPGARAAAARKPKMAAAQAEQGIAAAMQGLPAAPGGEAQAARSVGFAEGQRVRVTTSDALSLRLRKYAGKEGTITTKMGNSAWDVSFKGRSGGLASFDGAGSWRWCKHEGPSTAMAASRGSLPDASRYRHTGPA